MSRIVTYARLHTMPHLPHVGQIEDVFPGQRKTLDNLKMVTDDTSLDITFSYLGRHTELRIPLSNVQCMMLQPETEKDPNPSSGFTPKQDRPKVNPNPGKIISNPPPPSYLSW